MRYSYTLLDENKHIVDTFIKLAARVASGWILPVGGTLLVADNLNSNKNLALTSHTQVEEFIADSEQLVSRMREAQLSVETTTATKPWSPFDADGPQLAVDVASRLQGLVDSNPKTAAAVGKPKTSSVPPIAIMALGTAMQNGVDKYGKFNWRGTGVTASVFYDAMMRHLNEWYEGEDYASDSGIHHLAHLMAGGAILMDAMQHNVLNDDRNNGEYNRTVNRKSQIEVYQNPKK